jgi:hypothetical protein
MDTIIGSSQLYKACVLGRLTLAPGGFGHIIRNAMCDVQDLVDHIVVTV